MLKVCAIRHGQTDQNNLHRIQGQRDFPLNENGLEEARRLGEYFKIHKDEYSHIFVSPLKRAYQTACIIKESMGNNIPLDIEQAFIERSFGPREGMPTTKEVFKDILDDTAEGVEKSYELQKRVIDKLIELEKEFPNEKIIMVSHSHTIKAITTYVDSKKYQFIDKLDNCSAVNVTIDNGKVIIDGFNVHLF